VDGIEMKATTTSSTVDESLDDNAVDGVDADTTWMTSLPEISTLEYSPSVNTAPLTFGPYAGKQVQALLYRRRTARRAVPLDILPIAAYNCRN